MIYYLVGVQQQGNRIGHMDGFAVRVLLLALVLHQDITLHYTC